MSSFLKKECDLKYFHDNNYFRKKCKACGDYFWTLDENAELCGDQPCVKFSFIDNPLGKKPMSLSQVRESFLSFFEKNNHSRLRYPETGERCPVVARWRTDIYLTIASIADFQPHVTSGEVPPPANPLVISQPCIRLNDLEEVGVSGRHLTTFEMMGHHAFNKNVDEVYFKEKTVEYCNDYFVNEIGIPREKINYKEQMWYGGGNAGPCLEVLAAGLEIATLVFMNMRRDDSGDFEINDEKYSPNPLCIVDTGYGLERIAWITTGTKTVYETVLTDVINWINDNVGRDADKSIVYALADHTKCLSFMLGDGIVPSNVKAGYLSRLIIRRSLRFIEKLGLNVTLKKLVGMQLDCLEQDFPSLKKRRKQIFEILDVETERYIETLSKGKSLVKRLIKENEAIDTKQLIHLYDTHGMPPEIVKNIAKKHGVDVSIPENFDSMIAELHSHEQITEKIEEKESDLPKSDLLYYKDHYTKKFDGKVIWSKNNGDTSEIIVDKTCFYPEGGGQPADKGFFTKNGSTFPVKRVYKQNGSVIHVVEGDLKKGDMVHGEIDWDHRYMLMKHHTGTHVVNGALRKVLGEHVWQAGSQLHVTDARFDFSHYQPLTEEKIEEIENLANDFIKQEIDVEKKIMDRNSAEKTHGFRLYQGGVPPGNQIRVLNIPGVDVEACGGTHLNNIGEIEKIRILKSERIQDGVNRVVFAAGKMVDRFEKEEKQQYKKIISLFKDHYNIKNHDVDYSEQLQKTSEIFSVPVEQLEKTIQRFIDESENIGKHEAETLVEASEDLFNFWKKSQKDKKSVSSDELQDMIDNAEEIPGTDYKIITGKTTSEGPVTAGKLTEKDGYVVHVFDGKKIVSMASSDVDIDLREIVKEIAAILGGGGGGRPNMTQCGGPKIEKVDQALDKAKHLTIDLLKKE